MKSFLYKLKIKNQYLRIFILGMVLGAMCFCITYGIECVKFSNIEWLLNPLGSDVSFNVFAVTQYLHEPWDFPLGIIKSLIYPEVTSLVYTDGIPLFGIFFKLFAPWIKGDFQYFGLYGLMCFVLQGGFAALIIKKYTNNIVAILLVALAFIYSPPMIGKMFGHTSMAAHFILLAALCLWWYCNEEYVQKREIFFWTLILVICAGTSAYFIPMCMAILVGYIWCRYLRYGEFNIKKIIILMIIPVIITLLYLFIIGGLVDGTGFEGGLYGTAAFNLNGLINSGGFSHIIQPLSSRPGFQEGFAWLGLGVIILACIVIYEFIRYKVINLSVIKYAMPYLVVAFILIAFATSHIVTFGDKVLFTIPLPQSIINFCSIFRSSGRFIWPVYYMIYIALFGSLLKENFGIKKQNIIVGILILAQLIDLNGLLKIKKDEGKPVQTSLKSEFWNEVGNQYKHIAWLPLEGRNSFNELSELSYVAVRNKMTLNMYQLARLPEKVIFNSYDMIEQIKEGTAPEDYIYVLNQFSVLKNANLTNKKLYYLDNQYVLLDKNKTDMDKYVDAKVCKVENVRLEQYLNKVKNEDKGKMLIMSVKVDISAAIDDNTQKIFNELGFKTELMNKAQQSYVGTIIIGNEDTVEEYSSLTQGVEKQFNEGEMLGENKLINDIYIKSNGPGNESIISIDGINYSSGTRGLNICIYDMKTGIIEEVAAFDPYDGGDIKGGVYVEFE